MSNARHAPNTIEQHAGYLEEPIHWPGSIMNNARRTLKGYEYDTIVGTGLSGALVVPWLARFLHKNWAVVRKPNENTHSLAHSYEDQYGTVEGVLGRKWLFVDDLIDTGATRHRVKQAIQQFAEREHFDTEFVGTYLWGDGGGELYDAAGRYLARDLLEL